MSAAARQARGLSAAARQARGPSVAARFHSLVGGVNTQIFKIEKKVLRGQYKDFQIKYT